MYKIILFSLLVPFVQAVLFKMPHVSETNLVFKDSDVIYHGMELLKPTIVCRKLFNGTIEDIWFCNEIANFNYIIHFEGSDSKYAIINAYDDIQSDGNKENIVNIYIVLGIAMLFITVGCLIGEAVQKLKYRRKLYL